MKIVMHALGAGFNHNQLLFNVHGAGAEPPNQAFAVSRDAFVAHTRYIYLSFVFSMADNMYWAHAGAWKLCTEGKFFRWNKLIASLSWRILIWTQRWRCICDLRLRICFSSSSFNIKLQSKHAHTTATDSNNNCVTNNSSFWRRAPDTSRSLTFNWSRI